VDLLAKLRNQPGGQRLMTASERSESNAFLVGGAVRDLLLGRTPLELDVVVEGDASEFARLLGTPEAPVAPVEHPQFGTAVVELDDARIDVAQARRESYPAPGALPEVQPASIEEDMLRRDFTVNAIAARLDGQRACGERWHAAPGALEDLRAGRLRVLHDSSFVDDPTRLLRLARYAARLGFEVEPHTAALAAQAVQERALDTVSGGRIGAELRLALGESDPVSALAAMDELGLLTAIHPRLRFDRTAIERSVELLPDDGRRDLLTMAALSVPLALHADLGAGDYRAAGGHDPGSRAEPVLGGGEIAALLNRLEFPASDRDRVACSAVAVPRLVSELPAATSPSQLLEVVRGVPLEGIALAGGVDEAAAEPARRWLHSLRHIRLRITGEDLLAAGLSEGPDIGRRLDLALRMKLDGDVTDGREAELSAALEAQP
jgi:tRNA nucleotidyltransferase (CCA-adding enzyme)